MVFFDPGQRNGRRFGGSHEGQSVEVVDGERESFVQLPSTSLDIRPNSLKHQDLSVRKTSGRAGVDANSRGLGEIQNRTVLTISMITMISIISSVVRFLKL